MVLLSGTKASRIGVPLAFILAACGGGGGEPGISPQAGNGANTKLRPETYVERWWPDCVEGTPCPAPSSR
ncbi:hypothetical protein [Noviherbaspirillum denitrificans]|uniref:hypothetical protein n=1 Tax=Noviherbaspirillum denitrificans TaxID=1968433 RepID=UPI001130BDCD|nr:hypothetical protein [Noviherbaspirillum denitrificans]